MPDVCRVLPEQISQDLQQWQTKTSQSREERSRADRRARYLFGAALPFRPPRLHPARLQVKARRRPRQFAHAALGGPGEAVAHSDGLVHREDNFARVGRVVGGEVVCACSQRPDENRTKTNGTQRAGRMARGGGRWERAGEGQLTGLRVQDDAEPGRRREAVFLQVLGALAAVLDRGNSILGNPHRCLIRPF